MKEIIYRFADGHREKIMVSEEVQIMLEMLDRQERLLNRKESRRHVSLNYLTDEKDIEFSSGCPDLEEVVDTLVFNQKMRDILTDRQWSVYVKVYVEGKSCRQAARELGVYPNAVADAAKAILRKYAGL